jgi:arginine decarboxylase
MWTVEKSRIIHGIGRGDLDFLNIDDSGELCIRLNEEVIAIRDVIERAFQDDSLEGSSETSLQIQIPQLLSAQIEKLERVFVFQMKESGYSGRYLPLYPLKANHRVGFLENVLESHPVYGLEIGSKAELVLARRVLEEFQSRTVVCNGAKDDEYFRLARSLSAQDNRVLISLESVPEVVHALDFFGPGDIQFAFRVKPYMSSGGHWRHSGGRNAKFGLAVHELIEAADIFKDSVLRDDLVGVHGHLGSQLVDLDVGVADYGRYLTRIFFLLKKQGFPDLTTIDVGGGIPVDYRCEFNGDTITAFAGSLLDGIQDVCREEGATDHPTIMTESGRIVGAKATLILVRALYTKSVFPDINPTDSTFVSLQREMESIGDAERLETMWEEFKHPPRSAVNLEAIEKHEQRVFLFKSILRRRLLQEELEVTSALREWLFEPDYIVVGNFSVFKSVPDHVLVGQHFPVIPISGHEKQPQTTVRLADITCDSDGEISPFVMRQSEEDVLFTRDWRPLTSVKRFTTRGIPVSDPHDVDYFLIALTGAYQDALDVGPYLFRDLPRIELTLGSDGIFTLDWIQKSAQVSGMDDSYFRS